MMPVIGYDLLGLGHKLWPVKDTIESLPVGSAIGCFDNTFGDVLPNLRQMLKSGKFPYVRVHFWWDNNHEYVPLSFVKERAVVYEKLAKEFLAVRFYLSPSCEHKETNRKKVKETLKTIEKLAPSCIPVNSIWTGVKIKGFINEVHGVKAHARPGEIVSTDGISIYDINAETWLSKNNKASITFLWGLRFNLREVPEPGQALLPPKSRTAVPTKAYTKGIVRLAYAKGEAPIGIEATPIQKPSLYKTYAEDSQGVFDSRENKPVLILPEKETSVSIITKDEEVIGQLKYGGPYQSLHRYYSGVLGGISLYGWQIAELAKEKSGSEFVYFKIGSRVYGPCHPAFRVGYYQT